MHEKSLLLVGILSVACGGGGTDEPNATAGSSSTAGTSGMAGEGGSGGSALPSDDRGAAGSGMDGCQQIDRDRPYRVVGSALECSNEAIVIGPTSCLWECIELDGRQVRLEVLLQDLESDCPQASEVEGEALVSSDGVCRSAYE